MSRGGTGMPAGVSMNQGMGMLNGTPGAPMGDDYGPSLGRGLGVGSTSDQPGQMLLYRRPAQTACRYGPPCTWRHDMADIAPNANSVPGFPQDAYMEGPMMAMDEMVAASRELRATAGVERLYAGHDEFRTRPSPG